MPRVTITVPEKNAQPYRFQLDRKVVTLGRGTENDIMIDSGSVSVHHAEMRRVEGGYELHDIGSTNGIKLDGVRQEVIPLYSGSSLKIGDAAFDFSLTVEELEALERESPSQPSPITREPEIAMPPKPVVPQRSGYAGANSSGGGGFWSTFILLLLTVAAFLVGLSIRYQKDTNGSLWEAFQANRAGQSSSVPATAPVPVPRAEPGAEPAR